MTDPNPPSPLQIPEGTAAKFPALIDLIKGSESMNNEERQYWINILPIMTPEQLKNLQDILTSEREQLAAIDAKYAKATATGASVEEIGEKVRTKSAQRKREEEEHQARERSKEEDILSQIESV